MDPKYDPVATRQSLVKTYSERSAPSEAQRVAEALQRSAAEQYPETGQVRGQINDKIAELYAYDKDIGARYRDPNNEMFLENPMSRWQAEEERKGMVSGQVGSLFERLGRYQDLIGDTVEKGMNVWKTSLSTLKDQIDITQQDIQTQLEREKMAKEGSGTRTDNAFLNSLAAAASAVVGSRKMTPEQRKQAEEQLRRAKEQLAATVTKPKGLFGLFGSEEVPAGAEEGRAKLEENVVNLEAMLAADSSEPGWNPNQSLRELAQGAYQQRADLGTDINRVLGGFEQPGADPVSQQKIVQRESLRAKVSTNPAQAKKDFASNPDEFIQSAIQEYPALTANEIKAELSLLGFAFEK